MTLMMTDDSSINIVMVIMIIIIMFLTAPILSQTPIHHQLGTDNPSFRDQEFKGPITAKYYIGLSLLFQC